MEEQYSQKYLQLLGSLTIVILSSLGILSTLLTAYVIHWFFTPKNIIKDFSDVGYNHLFDEQRTKQTRKSKAEVARESRRKRVIGNIPPVFPNGWFAILDSNDIATEQVKHVAALGEDFAVFRDKGKRLHILSAICPHLGANIAVGGTIEGNCIRCPFHGWKFNGMNGKCEEIPYSKNVPEEAQIKRWHSCELNSFIFVWYHAENIEPTWYPEAIPNIKERKWWYRGRNEYYVNCHIQEIPENGADVTHLTTLHGPVVFAGSDLFSMHKWWSTIARHSWEASWAQKTEPGKRHIGSMFLRTKTIFFNRFKLFSMNVISDQIGPGYVVMNIETSFGPMIILQTVTPMEPLLQKVVHKIFYPFTMSLYGTMTFFTESILTENFERTIMHLLNEFERDVIVWNHKKYVDKPLFTKEESCIAKYRRWYSQFYSENSPRYKNKKDLDW